MRALFLARLVSTTEDDKINEQARRERHKRENDVFYAQANDYDLVHVLFSDFDIEPDQTCSYDYLEITAMETSKKQVHNNFFHTVSVFSCTLTMLVCLFTSYCFTFCFCMNTKVFCRQLHTHTYIYIYIYI